MRRLIIATAVLCFCFVDSYSQHSNKHLDYRQVKRVFADNCRQLDFSGLWTITDDYFIIGYISDTFQRFQIHYISVKKDFRDKNHYIIVGKIKIKDTVNSFTGHITIQSTDSNGIYGPDFDYDVNRDSIHFGTYAGVYEFIISPGQQFSGKLTGECTGQFYIDRYYKVQYDDILGWEHYSNNNFEGRWISPDNRINTVCNWGDYRVPQDSLLDGGVGEFIPFGPFVKNGWDDYTQIDNDQTEHQKYLADKKRSRWWE